MMSFQANKIDELREILKKWTKSFEGCYFVFYEFQKCQIKYTVK